MGGMLALGRGCRHNIYPPNTGAPFPSSNCHRFPAAAECSTIRWPPTASRYHATVSILAIGLPWAHPSLVPHYTPPRLPCRLEVPTASRRSCRLGGRLGGLEFQVLVRPLPWRLEVLGPALG